MIIATLMRISGPWEVRYVTGLHQGTGEIMTHQRPQRAEHITLADCVAFAPHMRFVEVPLCGKMFVYSTADGMHVTAYSQEEAKDILQHTGQDVPKWFDEVRIATTDERAIYLLTMGDLTDE